MIRTLRVSPESDRPLPVNMNPNGTFRLNTSPGASRAPGAQSVVKTVGELPWKNLMHFAFLLLAVSILGQTSSAIAGGTSGFNSDPYWGVDAENGSAGPSLDVFSTQDGLTWKTVKSTAYIAAGEDLRDPSMIVTGNVMWCAHTSGTSFGLCDYFSLIKSTDYGQTWSFVQHVYTVPGATQSWGPRLYRDKDGSVHVIIAVSSNNLGTLGCYELHPLGADLGGPWSNPLAVTINGAAPVSNEFYPLFAGGKYWLFYTSNFAYTCYATGTSLTGPYTQGGQILTSGSSFYVENPSIVPLSSGYGLTVQDGHQKFLTSTDLVHWSAESVVTLGTGIISTFCSQLSVMNDASLAIVTQPAGVTAMEGGGAAFSVAANDTPPTGYQWECMPAGSGTWLNLSDISGTYAGTATTTLTLGNVTGVMNGNQYRCVAGNGHLPDAISNAAPLTVQTGYGIWSGTFFSPEQLADPAISGPAATPQHDGVSNAVKYLTAINPSVPMGTGTYSMLPARGSITLSGTQYLTLTYRRNQNTPGLSLSVQSTADLLAWSNVIPDGTDTIGFDSSTGFPIVRLRVKMSSEPTMFIRLQITIQ
jgi:hypothetical protein